MIKKNNCKLSIQEITLLNKLGDCYNLFCKLPVQHDSDIDEFILHIHSLQYIIAKRLAIRCHSNLFNNKKKNKK